jgi:hypothetical protein
VHGRFYANGRQLGGLHKVVAAQLLCREVTLVQLGMKPAKARSPSVGFTQGSLDADGPRRDVT